MVGYEQYIVHFATLCMRGAETFIHLPCSGLPGPIKAVAPGSRVSRE